MLGLSRQLLWAVGCLAALCVLTAAKNSTILPPSTTTPWLSPPTTQTTSAPPKTLPTPAPGGRRSYGLPTLFSRAEPPAMPAEPGPGRAALRQHGGPSESSRDQAEVAAVAEVGKRPGGKGRRFPTSQYPARWCCLKVPRNPQPDFRLGRGDVASFRGGSGEVDYGARRPPPKLATRPNSLSLALVVCPPRFSFRRQASPEVGERGKETLKTLTFSGASDLGVKK